MPHIRAVVFDLGRVLLSIDPLRPKFAALMRAIGIRPEDAFRVYWREPEVIAHMTGKATPREFHAALCSRFGLSMEYPEFVDAWCDLFEPVPGMEDIFLRVEERHSIGILSDTDPLHWRKAVEILPWLSRVGKPTLSCEAGFLKPAPEIFREAARNVGAPAESCLFIDDLPDNVRGAQRAGMAGIVFGGAERLRGELELLGVL